MFNKNINNRFLFVHNQFKRSLRISHIEVDRIDIFSQIDHQFPNLELNFTLLMSYTLLNKRTSKKMLYKKPVILLQKCEAPTCYRKATYYCEKNGKWYCWEHVKKLCKATNLVERDFEFPFQFT